MGIISGLLLIVMGLLVARDFLGRKSPPIKKVVDNIVPYEQIIGVVGIVVGIIWFLDALNIIRWIGARGLFYLISALLMLALGIMLGMPMLHKLAGDPAPSFLTKLDVWAAKLASNKDTLGIAGIVLGIVVIFF